MIKSNYLEDNQDLQFVIQHCVDWADIIPGIENNFYDAKAYLENKDANLEFAPGNVAEALELYKMIHEQYGDICGNKIAPEINKMEKIGIRFIDGRVVFPDGVVKLVDFISDAGLLGYTAQRKYGGMNLPLTAALPVFEMLYRADLGLGLTIGCFDLAEIINRFGDEQMKSTYIPKMVSGKMTGAMALTEPDFGSDLQNITTKASKGENGTYYLTGTKRFITSGCGINDYPAVILTLARTGGPGARGLSFFLVESSDVKIARIEEKLGLHLSPTCEIVYENSPAQLIGQTGKGLLKYAMAMMNSARVGVAIQAVGVAQAAFAEAKKYADERVQFDTPISNIPAVNRLLSEMDASTQAIRALVYTTAQIVDLMEGRKRILGNQGINEADIRKDPQIIRWNKLARLLTPISKLFASEKANAIAYDAVQIFGGAGFTEEYDIAKIYRDVRITSIYEGTSQLQVVAAIGSIIEGIRMGSELMEYIHEKIKLVIDTDINNYLVSMSTELEVLVEYYRHEPDDIRKFISQDLVMYFTFFFCVLLLAEQVHKAPVEYKPKKQTAFSTFLRMANQSMQGFKANIHEYEYNFNK